MTRHVRLKTPCPLCQGRLDAVVRRMPLLGWHMVGLTCGHGCDIRWFNRDIDFSRSCTRPPKTVRNTQTTSSVAASNM